MARPKTKAISKASRAQSNGLKVYISVRAGTVVVICRDTSRKDMAKFLKLGAISKELEDSVPEGQNCQLR